MNLRKVSRKALEQLAEAAIRAQTVMPRVFHNTTGNFTKALDAVIKEAKE